VYNEEFCKLDFSHLSYQLPGGMALTSKAPKTWKHVTGCEICEGYGNETETSPVGEL